MNFDEVKYQIQNPVAGDVLTFEFGDALAIDTPIIEVHGDNILVYTDEIGGKLLNTLEAEHNQANQTKLQAWYEKYQQFQGTNGDPLPSGLLSSYIDTGILSDGAEANEYAKLKNKYGDDELTTGGFEQFFDEMPITKAMHYDFMQIMGISEIDEESCTEAAKILGDEVVGFTVEAEYRGRKVKLNKPTRGDVSKFKVYVKDPKTGNIKKVNFGHGGTSAKKRGEKTMKIRKSNPARRRSFRARHNCDNPGPKTKARYWSCRNW